MEFDDYNKMYDILLKSPRILTNDLQRVPKQKGVYLLWFEKNSEKLCLKVGQAGKRSGMGLRGRLQFHKGQNPEVTVLAKHMIRDYQFGLQFGYDFRERRLRKKFLASHCYWQVLPLPGSDRLYRESFELFLERRLKPRYSAERRYKREQYVDESNLLTEKRRIEINETSAADSGYDRESENGTSGEEMTLFCKNCEREVIIDPTSWPLFCPNCGKFILPEDQEKDKLTKDDLIREFGGVDGFVRKAYNDILGILKNEMIVETLSRGYPNEIISVTPSSIVLVSLETGNKRTLFKNDFHYYLRILGEKTCLDPAEDVKESRIYRKSRIMCAIMAQLSYVNYTLNPMTLFLVKRKSITDKEK